MKCKYRKASLLLTILGALLIGVELIKKQSETAVTIIGGADGPTSIFLAAKPGDVLPPFSIPVVLLAAALALFILSRKKD